MAFKDIGKKLNKNASVVKSQWGDYKTEVSEVIIPGIKEADGVFETLHKCQAFVEEWYDKQPRLNSYLFYPLVGFLAYGLYISIASA